MTKVIDHQQRMLPVFLYSIGGLSPTVIIPTRNTAQQTYVGRSRRIYAAGYLVYRVWQKSAATRTEISRKRLNNNRLLSLSQRQRKYAHDRHKK